MRSRRDGSKTPDTLKESANSAVETATLMHWKTVLLEWFTSLAPVLISLSWTLLSDQCATLSSSATRRGKLPRSTPPLGVVLREEEYFLLAPLLRSFRYKEDYCCK